jgi:uncharacterized membrane protein
LSSTDQDFAAKIAELMSTLDEIKKYKELARSMGDFVLLMMTALVAVLFIYIGFDLYQGLGGQVPQNLIVSGVEVLGAFVIFGAALVVGILWVDRRVSKVRVGEWESSLQKEGTIGAMKIFSSLDWPTVFQDIRYSKLGFVFYSALKVVGYWILAFIIIYLASSFGLYALHAETSFDYAAILSLIIVLVLSRKDIQKRYSQSWALDSLLWELRWFDSEFRGKAGFGEVSSAS